MARNVYVFIAAVVLVNILKVHYLWNTQNTMENGHHSSAALPSVLECHDKRLGRKAKNIGVFMSYLLLVMPVVVIAAVWSQSKKGNAHQTYIEHFRGRRPTIFCQFAISFSLKESTVSTSPYHKLAIESVCNSMSRVLVLL